MQKEEFIKLALKNSDDHVLCCKQQSAVNKYFFYIVKEGFCFYTDSYILSNFENFYKATLEFENLGFNNYNDCASALKFGINDKREFEIFSQSGFFNVNDPKSYQEFLAYKKGNFENKNEYLEAKKLQITTRQDYIDFIESGFQNFNAFINAKSHGFTNRNEFDVAQRLGYQEYSQYQEFIDSGCETREDFEFFKEKFPKIVKKLENTICQTTKDADNAFKSRRFEEFIRLKFLSIEKLTEVLFLKLFKKELKYENDMKVDDYISEIEKKVNETIGEPEEIKYWRRIRNKVIHENLKIKLDKAEKGKEFFDEIYGKLNGIFKKI